MTETPNYEDAQFIDAQAEDELLATAVERMRTSIPEWVPDESQTEMVLLEALCVLVGMTVWEINQLPQEVVEQLLVLYGVERSPGAQAEAVVEFQVSGAVGEQTVPVGTRLRYYLEETGESFDFITTESVTITTSEGLTGTVRAVAEEPGAALNGVQGVTLAVVDNLPQVENARIVGAVSGGVGPESDEDLYARGSAVFARQTSTLVLPEHFALAALTDPSVGKAAAFSLVDPARPGVEALGHITVTVANRDGNALSEGEATRITGDLTMKAVAGLTVHVEAPEYTGITVTIQVVKDAAAAAETVEADVRSALTAYLAPQFWDWRPTLIRNELLGVAAKVNGVAWVQGATVAVTGEPPAEEVTLTDRGYGAFPTLDSLTVEVVNP